VTVFLPHLETNLTLRCQLRCRSCNHFVGLDAHKSLPDVTPESLAHDLERLGSVAHSKAWAAIGGEPLLHPDLLELLGVACASRIADEIEIWTNGLLVRKQPPGFWMRIDKLVLSAYPGKMSNADVAWIRAACEETETAFELKDARMDSYFTALLYREPKDAAGARAQHAQCWFRTYTHVVDGGRFYACCTSPFIAPLVLGMEQGHDGLDLEGITEESLRAFLTADEPLAGCTVCGAHNGPRQSWIEVKGPEAWLEASRI